MSDGDLPVVDPDDLGTPDTGKRVAGVLLAAGTSSRYGETNKLLVEYEGDPLVVHAARTLLAADVSPVVVVLGHEAERVRAALADLPVETVENPDYAQGQATSVRRGIEAVRDRDPVPHAALFALGDMPEVTPATVDILVRAYRAGAGDALAAAYEGQRGNPVLFDARHFDALADVDGDTGGREILLSGSGSALVETGDPGVRRDVDRPGDVEDLS